MSSPAAAQSAARAKSPLQPLSPNTPVHGQQHPQPHRLSGDNARSTSSSDHAVPFKPIRWSHDAAPVAARVPPHACTIDAIAVPGNSSDWFTLSSGGVSTTQACAVASLPPIGAKPFTGGATRPVPSGVVSPINVSVSDLVKNRAKEIESRLLGVPSGSSSRPGSAGAKVRATAGGVQSSNADLLLKVCFTPCLVLLVAVA